MVAIENEVLVFIDYRDMQKNSVTLWSVRKMYFNDVALFETC